MSIEVEWARMTAPDLRAIAAREGALAILPAGSLEQHGPHLPVITDTASASAAAVAAARLVAAEAVPVAVLPGLWLGLSEHHLPFGGTISVDYAAYRAILESIVRSLRALGFARLLIVNGHGGNIDPLAVAVARVGCEIRSSDRRDDAVVPGAGEDRGDLRSRIPSPGTPARAKPR